MSSRNKVRQCLRAGEPPCRREVSVRLSDGSDFQLCDVYLGKIIPEDADPESLNLCSLSVLDACNHRVEHSINFRPVSSEAPIHVTFGKLALLSRLVRTCYFSYFHQNTRNMLG